MGYGLKKSVPRSPLEVAVFTRSALVLGLGIVAGACDSASMTAPTRDDMPTAQLSFMNGPEALPQILRFESRVIAGWIDERRNLAVIIGAPPDPQQSRICGGTVRNQFMPMQFVGDLDAVVKQLLLAPDANVLAYDAIAPSLEDALCGMTPVGQGTGLYTRRDNDLFGTGGDRTNAFGEHVRATLTMTDGTVGHLSGGIRGIGRDGGLVFADTWLVLTPRP
jgi:hypothetical protein